MVWRSDHAARRSSARRSSVDDLGHRTAAVKRSGVRCPIGQAHHADRRPTWQRIKRSQGSVRVVAAARDVDARIDGVVRGPVCVVPMMLRVVVLGVRMRFVLVG